MSPSRRPALAALAALSACTAVAIPPSPPAVSPATATPVAASAAPSSQPPAVCARGAWSPAVAEARWAVMKNDGDALRRFFAWVGPRTDLPDLAARTRALADDPRTQPGEGDPSDIVDLGAEAIADVGLACAACHVRAGVKPKIGDGAAPPVDPSLNVHMARHSWALERLWEGLIGPSDPRWIEGVSALHDHPIEADRLHGREGGESPSDYMDWWIHQPGPSTALAADHAGRASFYGHLLTACAACHAGTAGAPAVPAGP